MSTDLERELERTTQMRGFRDGMHDFLAQVKGWEALKKHNDNVADSHYLNKNSPLDRKTIELLVIVACVAQRDKPNHLQTHMHAAHKAGATPEEIFAVLQLVNTWVGAVATASGMEAWRQTFRPDLPTTDRIVELR